jgi:hypothetical protein
MGYFLSQKPPYTDRIIQPLVAAPPMSKQVLGRDYAIRASQCSVRQRSRYSLLYFLDAYRTK